MPKRESAWKQMIHFYRDEYQEQHAPMLYGDVWLQTKSRNRLNLGLTDTAKATLQGVTTVELPTKHQHVAAGEPLATINDAQGSHAIASPFGGTVIKSNASLAAEPAALTTNTQKANWFVWLKAD